MDKEQSPFPEYFTENDVPSPTTDDDIDMLVKEIIQGAKECSSSNLYFIMRNGLQLELSYCSQPSKFFKQWNNPFKKTFTFVSADGEIIRIKKSDVSIVRAVPSYLEEEKEED